MLGAMEPRGVGFMPNQLFLYWIKSVTSFWSSGENFNIVDSALIKCSRSSVLAVMYLKNWIVLELENNKYILVDVKNKKKLAYFECSNWVYIHTDF